MVKFQPNKQQNVVDKYKIKDSNNIESLNFDTVDFKCPLSGEIILSEPVTLNGYIYDKDTLEDWIYRSDWLDPLYIFDKQNEK